jgi:hypothetical protein
MKCCWKDLLEYLAVLPKRPACLGSCWAPCRWSCVAGLCVGCFHWTTPFLVDLVFHISRGIHITIFIDCGAISKIPNGVIRLVDNNTTFGASGFVTCNFGYHTLTPNISCQENGTWSTAVCSVIGNCTLVKKLQSKKWLNDYDDLTKIKISIRLHTFGLNVRGT